MPKLEIVWQLPNSNWTNFKGMMLGLLRELSHGAAELLEIPMRGSFPPRIDLSVQNIGHTGERIFEFARLQGYVQGRMAATGSPVVWGGYLEQRLIYDSSPLFHGEAQRRDIHLGLDFWAAAGVGVFAPLAGRVHSFQDNAGFRDYGGTVILEHRVGSDFAGSGRGGVVFHSLYGHLSRRSLEGLFVGMEVARGGLVGELGTVEENGGWPPHLHFQLVVDMQGMTGDYPGVCAVEELKGFVPNCPDPRFLLGL
jgi:hypothetical protein